MSFFSDLFKGNFSNLGNDITHAPSSFANHPGEILEGGAAAALAALTALTGGADLPFLSGLGGAGEGALGGLGGLFGAGEGAAGGAADLGLSSFMAPDAVDAAYEPFSSFSAFGQPTSSAFDITGASLPNSPDFTIGNSVLQPGDISPSYTANPFGGDITPTASGTSYSNPLSLGDAGLTHEGATAASTGGGGGNSILNFLKSNAGWLAPTALAGGGLAANLLGGKLGNLAGRVPNQDQLQGLAGQAGSRAGANQAYASQLEAPLTTGVLPAGAETSVQNALRDATTTIKARYASLGLSGSTQEQDAITAAQSNAEAMRFQIAEQMAQTGLSAGQQALSDLQLQDSIYMQLMQAQISQDQALQNAIANFTGQVGRGAAQGAFSSK